MHFGAGEQERALNVSFDQALSWESREGKRVVIEPGPHGVISLPPLEEIEDEFWPSWLHVGFFVTNSG
jgi:hypothetical protein